MRCVNTMVLTQFSSGTYALDVEHMELSNQGVILDPLSSEDYGTYTIDVHWAASIAAGNGMTVPSEDQVLPEPHGAVSTLDTATVKMKFSVLDFCLAKGHIPGVPASDPTRAATEAERETFALDSTQAALTIIRHSFAELERAGALKLAASRGMLCRELTNVGPILPLSEVQQLDLAAVIAKDAAAMLGQHGVNRVRTEDAGTSPVGDVTPEVLPEPLAAVHDEATETKTKRHHRGRIRALAKLRKLGKKGRGSMPTA
ncbi:hypothetical protein J8273_8231 [Carpediemonas membranifera]|uniref:Uncharacterized protein n=1 Tax=Carpediemonas membranifera TaxID=201153 RepID=A0A8J6DZB3_9EUKA|nr:hypothetical protein J8273_8231 [Carpediemonas membranifera]|eukprot:KAG9390191.1 hypothetical protein J8273_8231 [Carpediemonas membranifera]